jgi:hypothetical protein
LTGAEEGADPTLTHDLLNRSREGQWSEFVTFAREMKLMESSGWRVFLVPQTSWRYATIEQSASTTKDTSGEGEEWGFGEGDGKPFGGFEYTGSERKGESQGRSCAGKE